MEEVDIEQESKDNSKRLLAQKKRGGKKVRDESKEDEHGVVARKPTVLDSSQLQVEEHPTLSHPYETWNKATRIDYFDPDLKKEDLDHNDRIKYEAVREAHEMCLAQGWKFDPKTGEYTHDDPFAITNSLMGLPIGVKPQDAGFIVIGDSKPMNE
jgi:hypothetical protein